MLVLCSVILLEPAAGQRSSKEIATTEFVKLMWHITGTCSSLHIISDLLILEVEEVEEQFFSKNRMKVAHVSTTYTVQFHKWGMGRVVHAYTLPLQGREIIPDRPLAQVKSLQSSLKKKKHREWNPLGWPSGLGLGLPCRRSQVRNPFPAKSRGLPFGSSSSHRGLPSAGYLSYVVC